MASFRDKSFDARLGQMGDLAERRFEEVHPRGYVRYGLNRPPVKVSALPRRIRYTPDYLTADSLVEVQGFGTDQTLKLKLEKWDSLRWWHGVHPVELFVYDSKRKRHVTVPLDQIEEWIHNGEIEFGRFPEGKAYFGIPAAVVFR